MLCAADVVIGTAAVVAAEAILVVFRAVTLSGRADNVTVALRAAVVRAVVVFVVVVVVAEASVVSTAAVVAAVAVVSG